MSKDNTVAIVAIVVTGSTALVTAILAAITASIRHRQQLEHERRLGDTSELRRVLDDAARGVGVALVLIVEVNAEYVFNGRRAADESEEMKEYEEARKTALYEDGRLALRLGRDHPLYEKYRAFANRFVVFRSKWLESDTWEEHGYTDEERFSQEERTDRVEPEYKSLLKARNEFMEAATRYAGVNLPDRAEARKGTPSALRLVLTIQRRDS